MKMMTTTLKRSAEWYFVERMSVAQRNGGLSAIPPIPSIREDMAELHWEPSLVRSDNIPVAVYVVHRHVYLSSRHVLPSMNYIPAHFCSML